MNSKKLREALENSNGLLEELTLFGEQFESAREQIKENNAALAAAAEPIANAKLHEADDWRSQLMNLINGEVSHYMSQGTDYLWVIDGPWSIKYDNTKGENDGDK